PNVPTENCTVARDVQIEEGTTEDWKKLSGFHYRSHTFGAPRNIFCLKKGEELCGVIIYSFPPLTCFGRAKVLPKMPLDELNKKLSTVSRVVVHPKYRSIGLGSLLLKKSLPLAGTPFVEMVAVMAKYNPFAEKAGMKKIAESKPSKHTLQALEQLKKLGFDTLTLNSPRCCGRTIKKVGKKAVTKVLIELAENEGSVRRVLLGNSKAYPNLAQFAEKLESLDESRLAAVLKRLSFLAQSKAYLFWQNPTSKAILGTS
ncbi:MAG: GNAT family N-acetyltransferase, partial [Candidatus Bathyarchaeia archaeon]